MPTVNALQVLPPTNWQDFEELCCDLWKELWKDPHARRHGRRGQPQCGVDVFGQPGGGPDWAGVQCKLKDHARGKLTRKEIEDEVAKAADFNPRLATFVIATTADSDAAAQAVAREITERGSLRVSIASWDDIWQDLTKYPEIVAKHYPHLADGDRRQTAGVRTDYLARLWTDLYPVPMLAVATGAGGRDDLVPLASVYTALDVTAEVVDPGPDGDGLAGSSSSLDVFVGLRGDDEIRSALWTRLSREAKKAGLRNGPPREWESYRRRATALEAAAVAPRLVLLGQAGSGKSTFARFLALSLAGEALGKSEANLALMNEAAPEVEPELLRPWPHGPLLPIFAELRRFVRDPSFPGVGVKGAAGDLLTFLGAADAESSFGRLLREALLADGGGALLVLDGLDEMPVAEESRQRLQQVIRSWVLRFPTCRVLVTSRPYAYEPGSPWRLDESGFEQATLAPFGRDQTRRYVEGWYRHLVSRKQIDSGQAERQGKSLVREIESTGYLEPLAERPLMLSMMTDLHARSGGRFRGGRAGLYERSVELLLDRWNEVREVPEVKTAAEHLGMEIDRVRRAIEDLAYDVHRSRGVGGDGESSEITAEEVWQALGRHRRSPDEQRVDERYVMGYLHQRSGILLGDSESQYRFPHRSYQEYLAACHLTRVGFPGLLVKEARTAPELWREVLLLAVGKTVAAEMPFMAWTLLGDLVPEPPGPADRDARDPRFLAALYSGLAVRENGLWSEEQRDERKLGRIRQWLERCLEVGALSPADRMAAGQVLGLLGDRRPGVGLRADGLPDVDWVNIPAGKFQMGDDRKETELAAFRISRHPVTNLQYRAFVDDGGYTAKRRSCWTAAGWEWKGGRIGPDDGLRDDSFLLPNHPRVNVCWFEARAFCCWLGERLGVEVSLPSEERWERAARGTDGRRYPWGGDFDASHCNVRDTGLGRTCAVGSFPGGASSDGVLDMSGNVWEWCSTKYGRPGRVTDEDPEGTASRVLRGGSFAGGYHSARCAFRRSRGPRFADFAYGFRVSAPI